MASRQVNRGEVSSSRRRPATTPEGRENQLVAAAIDLAEKQIQEGTASAQVITHYLKVTSTRERVELERIRGENRLIQAKIDNMASTKRLEELFEEAAAAMTSYRTSAPDDLRDYDGKQ